MRAAVNGPGEDAWLEMAARREAAAGAVLDLDGLDLSHPRTAQFVLDTGLLPPSGSWFEADLILSDQPPDALPQCAARHRRSAVPKAQLLR